MCLTAVPSDLFQLGCIQFIKYVSHIWEDYSSLRPVYSVRSSDGLGLVPDELGWVSVTLQGTGSRG